MSTKTGIYTDYRQQGGGGGGGDNQDVNYCLLSIYLSIYLSINIDIKSAAYYSNFFF